MIGFRYTNSPMVRALLIQQRHELEAWLKDGAEGTIVLREPWLHEEDISQWPETRLYCKQIEPGIMVVCPKHIPNYRTIKHIALYYTQSEELCFIKYIRLYDEMPEETNMFNPWEAMAMKDEMYNALDTIERTVLDRFQSLCGSMKIALCIPNGFDIFMREYASGLSIRDSGLKYTSRTIKNVTYIHHVLAFEQQIRAIAVYRIDPERAINYILDTVIEIYGENACAEAARTAGSSGIPVPDFIKPCP